MERFRQDLVVSLRRLRSSPGFTLAAILTLALGIGANIADLHRGERAAVPPAARKQPDQLVSLNMRGFNTEFPVQSYPNYLDFRDRNNVLPGLAGYRMAPVGLSRGDANNARLWAFEVTGNYFDVLGIGALRGRVFGPKDDVTRGGHPIAILTYATWQRQFAGDANVVGKKIKINGMDYTIIGVTPRGFTGTEVVFTPDIFVPMAMTPQIEPGSDWLDQRGSMNMFVVGRLKPGVALPRAEAALNSIAAELGRQYPKDNAGVTIFLSKAGLFGTMVRGPVRAFAAVLLGVSGLVLLLACVNLAGMSLARASDRRKESAIRLALEPRPAGW